MAVKKGDIVFYNENDVPVVAFVTRVGTGKEKDIISLIGFRDVGAGLTQREATMAALMVQNNVKKGKGKERWNLTEADVKK